AHAGLREGGRPGRDPPQLVARLPGAPRGRRDLALTPEVLVIYRKELRSALRERSIVLNSVLIPVFLYPVMLWLLFTGLTFAEGLAEGTRSRVVVHGLTAEHAEVFDSLQAMPSIELLQASPTVEESEARLAAGELDAVAEFEAVP